jgi:hypothetical protein
LYPNSAAWRRDHMPNIADPFPHDEKRADCVSPPSASGSQCRVLVRATVVSYSGSSTPRAQSSQSGSIGQFGLETQTPCTRLPSLQLMHDVQLHSNAPASAAVNVNPAANENTAAATSTMPHTYLRIERRILAPLSMGTHSLCSEIRRPHSAAVHVVDSPTDTSLFPAT